MSFEDVVEVIAMFAKSQGFYGRVLEAIGQMDSDEICEFAELVEAQGFNDALDVVMWFEC